jgi:hypothetical protein
MAALIFLFLNLVASLFKSKSQLEAENAALRHQLAMLQRKLRGRVGFQQSLGRLRSSGPRPLCAGIVPVFAATGAGNHAPLEAGQIAADLRAVIRQMSVDNLLWGAPRIHGELLKLGFSVAQSTVAKYWPRKVSRPVRPGAPSCVIMRRILQPWICLWFRPSVLTYFTFWSLFSCPGESLSESMRVRQLIRQRNGSRSK